LLRLVWPVLVEQLLLMLVGLSDTFLAGRNLSRSHLAAMTSMSYVMWLLTNLFAIVAIGATALTARYVGAQDQRGAVRATNQSVLIGAVLAAALTVLGWLFGEQLIGLMRLDGDAARFAVRFLNLLVPVLPAMMVESVGIAALRGAGDMVTGLVTMCLVNVVNLAVSWSLLQGIGPIPPQGWDGIAIGTASGHATGGLVVLAILLRGRRGFRLRLADMRPDWTLIRRILWVGVPGGIDVLSLTICQLAFLSMINQLGELAAAAHGVAIRIESLAYLPGGAFQVAAATLAGQYLGAGDRHGARRSVLTACAFGGGVMSVIGLLMFLNADQLVGFFLSQEQLGVPQASAPLLRIISFAMLPLAIMNVLTGALRGAGDTRWPLLITLIGFLGVRMPLAYGLSFSLGWGVRGAWYAMTIDLTLRCVLVVARFCQGGWQRLDV
jgi:putative MATE family efflux protein